MGKTENVKVNVYINGKEAGKNLKGIRGETRKLRNELAQLTPGTEAFRKKVNELKSVNKKLRTINDDVRGVGGAFGKLKNEVKAFGIVALGALGAGALMQGMDNLINRNAKLSDSFADVMKTTGLTKIEVEELSKEFKAFNTRSSRKELLGLARIAGKLGIEGKKNILGFVKAADQINVALSEDLGGSAEEALRQLGKLVELFGVSGTYNMEESLMKVGSAINSLGAASTANESYLVEFTKRLGGVASTANISIQDILGMASTLDQLGQTSEVSATVLTQLIVKMGKDVPRFAKLAGMSVNQFSAILQDDANAALIAVIENMESSTGGAEGMAKALDQLGLDGVRSAGVVSALSGHIDLLKEQQRLSNKEFSKGTSLTQEFNIKNKTLAGSLERVQKWMARLFINSDIQKGLAGIVGWMDRLISIPVSETMEKERISLVGIEFQLKNTNLKHEDRIKLIKELQEKYPNYLGNLDAEKATNKELSNAIKLVNDQLVNKIILQKQDEKVEENNRVIAEKKMEIFKQEDVLYKKVASLKKAGYKITLKEGTVQEQMLDVNRQLLEQDKGKVFNKGILFNKQVQFSHQLYVLIEKNKILNGLENTGNALMKQKNDLLKRLGITTQETSKITNNGAKTTTKIITDEAGKQWKVIYDATGKEIERKELVTKLTKEQLEEIARLEAEAQKEKEAAEKKLADFIIKQKEEVHLDTLSGYERDVAEIELKYSKMIELARKFGFDSKAAELEGMMTAQTMQAMSDGMLGDVNNLADEQTENENDDANASMDDTLLENELAKLNISEEAKLALKAEYYLSDFNNFKKFLADKEQAQYIHNIKLQKQLQAFQAGANAIFSTMYAVNEAMMRKELDRAGNDGAKKEEITKKYARKRQSIAINEALIQGALGIVKTGANMGYPAAIPFQIAQGIQTAAQMVIIKNQKFAKGGYTGFGLGFADDTGKQVAGTVHANEYVIPETLLSNPWVANVTRSIESMRQGKQGFADGGPTTNTTSDLPEFNQGSIDTTYNSQLLQEATLIRQLLQRGVLAYYDEEQVAKIKKVMDEAELVKQNAIK